MELTQAKMLANAKARCDLFVNLYPETVDISRVRIIVTDKIFRWKFKNYAALALGPRTIILHPDVAYDETLITHELVHIWQAQALGNLRQLVEYEIESHKKGYRNNRFEVEARFIAGQE